MLYIFHIPIRRENTIRIDEVTVNESMEYNVIIQDTKPNWYCNVSGIALPIKAVVPVLLVTYFAKSADNESIKQNLKGYLDPQKCK